MVVRKKMRDEIQRKSSRCFLILNTRDSDSNADDIWPHHATAEELSRRKSVAVVEYVKIKKQRERIIRLVGSYNNK